MIPQASRTARITSPSSSPRQRPGAYGNFECLVVLERMRRRRESRRQRPLRERLEIGDAGVAPPLRFLLLDRQERADLRETFGIDVIAPRPAHVRRIWLTTSTPCV